MKRRKTSRTPKIQDTLLPNLNTDAEVRALELKEVIKITPNICMQKNVCQHCGRGDRYGIPLHFLFHYPDGDFKTVCFGCGKKAASETGLRLPPTEADIFAQEEERDLKVIYIARHKMKVKNGNI